MVSGAHSYSHIFRDSKIGVGFGNSMGMYGLFFLMDFLCFKKQTKEMGRCRGRAGEKSQLVFLCFF